MRRRIITRHWIVSIALMALLAPSPCFRRSASGQTQPTEPLAPTIDAPTFPPTTPSTPTPSVSATPTPTPTDTNDETTKQKPPATVDPSKPTSPDEQPSKPPPKPKFYDFTNPSAVFSEYREGVDAWRASLDTPTDEWGNAITACYLAARRPDYVNDALQSFLRGYYAKKDEAEKQASQAAPEPTPTATEQGTAPPTAAPSATPTPAPTQGQPTPTPTPTNPGGGEDVPDIGTGPSGVDTGQTPPHEDRGPCIQCHRAQ